MGLIALRNPLVYPGGQAGFDPNHLASPGVRLSAVFGVNSVNSGQTGYFRVLAGPTISGSPTAFNGNPSGVNAIIGPCAHYASTTNGKVTATNEHPSSFTVAAILEPIASSTPAIIFLNNAGDNGSGSAGCFFTLNSLVLRILAGGAYVSSLITLSTNTPYFVAASYNGTTANFVVRNLANGVLTTAAISQSQTIGTTTAGAYDIGGSDNQGWPVHAYMAAVYYGINNYMPMNLLQEWSGKPWEFWYPAQPRWLLNISKNNAVTTPAVGNADGTSSVSGVGASLFKAVGNADGTSSVAGVGASLAKSVGNADGVASVSGVGASLSGSHGNADGSASVSGVSTAVFSAVGHADGQANVNGVGVTAAVATGHADGQANVNGVGFSVVPPVPLVPPALRQRSYKHRFLGRSFDPQVVVEKDRPGPLRIIEFSAWMD